MSKCVQNIFNDFLLLVYLLSMIYEINSFFKSKQKYKNKKYTDIILTAPLAHFTDLLYLISVLFVFFFNQKSVTNV